MKHFPFDKYKYFVNGNKVIAVSTYAGKTVRGTAICHPSDPFDLEIGKKLAAMRCDLKVRNKRQKAAAKRFDAAYKNWCKADNEKAAAADFLEDAENDFNEALNNLADFEESLHEAAINRENKYDVKTDVAAKESEPNIKYISATMTSDMDKPEVTSYGMSSNEVKSVMARFFQWLKEN